MGKYRIYSRSLGDAFKLARESYDNALRELKAEEERYKNSVRVNRADPVKLLSAEASYRTAQAIFKEKTAQIWSDFEKLSESTTKEFKAQLRADQLTDPTQLDLQTVEILRSGICTAQDLQALTGRFSDNPTMLRMISQHAKVKADATKDDALRAPYAEIANRIDRETYDIEKRWDEMTSTFKIISGQAHGRGNPGYTQTMNAQYESLAEPMVDSF